jgi:hypothetical protein
MAMYSEHVFPPVKGFYVIADLLCDCRSATARPEPVSQLSIVHVTPATCCICTELLLLCPSVTADQRPHGPEPRGHRRGEGGGRWSGAGGGRERCVKGCAGSLEGAAGGQLHGWQCAAVGCSGCGREEVCARSVKAVGARDPHSRRAPKLPAHAATPPKCIDGTLSHDRGSPIPPPPPPGPALVTPSCSVCQGC